MRAYVCVMLDRKSPITTAYWAAVTTGVALIGGGLAAPALAQDRASQDARSAMVSKVKCQKSMKAKLKGIKTKNKNRKFLGKVVHRCAPRGELVVELGKKGKKRKKKKWVPIGHATWVKGKPVSVTTPRLPGPHRIRAFTPNRPLSKNSPTSRSIRLGAAPATAANKGWVIGLGDSYMSGEGASYAGYGPWNGTNQPRLSTSDKWWIDTFGENLQQTYPGDFQIPIAQPGTLTPSDRDYFNITPSGVQCHRSGSASMHWNDPQIPSLNLACSGAQSNTGGTSQNPSKGKPGIDFVTGGADGIGQALQLEEFAKLVKKKGEQIDVIQYSIGGNDIQFADIVSDCVQRFLTPLEKKCGDTKSKSLLQTQYKNGSGLEDVVTAVTFSGENIITAMSKAGFEPGSYTMVVTTYPIGVPPSNEFETDFGGNSGFGRQLIGGCGFADVDLDFITGGFKDLLQDRVLEGAKVLNDKHAEAKVRVLDATNATNGHQLCSDQITYPKEQNYGANYPPNGPAQQGPPWAGVQGGSTGPWINPISVCIEEQQDVRFFCNWKTTYPTLFNAMQCEPSDPSQSDCQTGALANAQSLPIHPNHWGQRALAACHANAAASAQPGDITACTPPVDSLGLDAYGRPMMVATKSGDLANFTPTTSSATN